jgi:hypothetical protein
VGISQLRERSDISFHFAARTALDASLKATSCIALEMPMEFWASDMGRPWRFSHAAPATRAAGLKRRRGPVRRNVPLSRAIIGDLVWIQKFFDRVE